MAQSSVPLWSLLLVSWNSWAIAPSYLSEFWEPERQAKDAAKLGQGSLRVGALVRG